MGAIVQAPWKQTQMTGGADAENKLGLAGGCDPASLGQFRNSREKSRSGPLELGLCPGLLAIQTNPVSSPGQSGSRGGKGQPGNWQYIHGKVGLWWGHWSCICCFIFCSISCMRLS